MLKYILVLGFISLINVNAQLIYKDIPSWEVQDITFSPEGVFFAHGLDGVFFAPAGSDSFNLISPSKLQYKLFNVIEYYDGTLLVGGHSRGIFRSLDNGITYDSALGYDPEANRQTMALYSYQGNLIFSPYGGNIYFSSNKGLNWKTSLQEGTKSYGRHFFTIEDTLYSFFSAGGIFKYHNGKWSDTALAFLTEQITALTYSNGAIYAAIMADGLYKSTDAGYNWTRLNAFDSIGGYIEGLEGTGDIIWGTTSNKDFYSPDGGRTFIFIKYGSQMDHIKANGNRLYYVKRNGRCTIAEIPDSLAIVQFFNKDKVNYQKNFTLKWPKVSTAIGYNLEIYKDKALTQRIVNEEINGTSYSASSGLFQEGDRYYGRLRYAYNEIVQGIKGQDVRYSWWSSPIPIAIQELTSVEESHELNAVRLEIKDSYIFLSSDIPISGVKLYDIIGTLKLSKDQQKEKSFILDIKNISRGIYLLEVQLEDKIEVQKFIVE